MYKIEDGKLVFYIENNEILQGCNCEAYFGADDDYIIHEFKNHVTIADWVNCIECNWSYYVKKSAPGFIECVNCKVELFIGNYVYAVKKGY